MELNKIHVSVILAIATLGIASALVVAILSASKTIPNSGNIKAIGVGVYSDSGCSQEVRLIEWKSLVPGETRNVTVYIRNEGNVAMVLNMTTDEWNPESASSHITLRWNREGYVLIAGSYVQTVLTLSVSSSISGVESFTFDIIITGIEST